MTQPANSTFQLGELGMFEMVFTYQGRSSDETGKEKFSFRAVVKRNGEKASDNLADPESFSNRRPEDLVVGVHNGTDVENDRFFEEIDKYSMGTLFQPCQDFLTATGRKGGYPPPLPPPEERLADDSNSQASKETEGTAHEDSAEGPDLTQTEQPPSVSYNQPHPGQLLDQPESTIQTQQNSEAESS